MQDRSAAYLLRVAIEEIEFMEDELPLARLPHIAKFVTHPAGRFLLRHVQNFCWTVERATRSVGEAPQKRGAAPVIAPAAAVVNANPAQERPRIWIDVTNTRQRGFSGGIERVILQLTKAAGDTGLALPVYMEEGEIYECVGAAGRGPRLEFGPGVVYAVVDSFWQQIDEYVEICGKARSAGAKIVTCIHDVIPLYYPSFNRPAFVRAFVRAFVEMMEVSDACLAVSQYSANKVQAFVTSMGLRSGRRLPVASFQLGADGHVCVDLRQVRERVRRLFAGGSVFLSVGTLEPRKGYAVTLDAFDQLWARRVDCSFVIIGQPGWISKALERRIIEHPAYGERLHWLDDAADAELTYAYRNARCVIQASITEGFGLPVVEANFEGAPVIVTDNEVFREVGGDEITYFRSCDSADLAAKIEAAVRERPRVGRLHPLKWDQSLAQMVARIDEMLATSSDAGR